MGKPSLTNPKVPHHQLEGNCLDELTPSPTLPTGHPVLGLASGAFSHGWDGSRASLLGAVCGSAGVGAGEACRTRPSLEARVQVLCP